MSRACARAQKTRATKVETAVKAAVPSVTASVNPEKPRKGCFEVRVDGADEPLLSLLDMKRPFPALKALDMEAVTKDIISKLTAE